MTEISAGNARSNAQVQMATQQAAAQPPPEQDVSQAPSAPAANSDAAVVSLRSGNQPAPPAPKA